MAWQRCRSKPTEVEAIRWTGITVVGDGERSQLANKAKAPHALRQQLEGRVA